MAGCGLLATVSVVLGQQSPAHAYFFNPPVSCLAGTPFAIGASPQYSEGQRYWSYVASASVTCNNRSSVNYDYDVITRFSVTRDAQPLDTITWTQSPQFVSVLTPAGVPGSVRTITQKGTGFWTACETNQRYTITAEALYRWKASGTSSWSFRDSYSWGQNPSVSHLRLCW